MEIPILALFAFLAVQNCKRLIYNSHSRFPPSVSEPKAMPLEKEWIDRADAIRTAIVQLRDSL